MRSAIATAEDGREGEIRYLGEVDASPESMRRLRAGDVRGLRLDDFDWAGGTVCVSGKSRRGVRLPLPQDASDAVLAYIEKGRPVVAEDKLFLRSTAPYRPFTASSSISYIVARALRRAGIEDPPSTGATLLRHSAATAMLRGGATLQAGGAVLRHRSPDMTAHYAKVDVTMLEGSPSLARGRLMLSEDLDRRVRLRHGLGFHSASNRKWLTIAESRDA